MEHARGVGAFADPFAQSVAEVLGGLVDWLELLVGRAVQRLIARGPLAADVAAHGGLLWHLVQGPGKRPRPRQRRNAWRRGRGVRRGFVHHTLPPPPTTEFAGFAFARFRVQSWLPRRPLRAPTSRDNAG